MEDLAEDIVSNPALLKKILIKALNNIDDVPKAKIGKTELEPWKGSNYRPERSSKPEERKSKTT